MQGSCYQVSETAVQLELISTLTRFPVYISNNFLSSASLLLSISFCYSSKLGILNVLEKCYSLCRLLNLLIDSEFLVENFKIFFDYIYSSRL